MDKERMELIANLLLQQVSARQISLVVGLDESRISQIQTEPAFQQIYADIAATRLQQNQEVDDGWDAVERNALSVVKETLKWKCDPDYALKAAALANRATRRAVQAPTGRPIIADAGARITINLNQAFVQKLRNFETAIIGTPEVKQIDRPTPRQVQNMLGTIMPDRFGTPDQIEYVYNPTTHEGE